MVTTGRPKVPDGERRNKQIKLSLTEAEHSMLTAIAEQRNKKLGEMARDIVVDYVNGVPTY